MSAIKKLSEEKVPPFAKFPTELLLAHGLSPNAAKLLAYRLCFVGAYALHSVHASRCGLMKRDTFYDALAELIDKGFITREQAHGGRGGFQRVIETVHAREVGPKGRDYVWLWQRLILKLPPAALALYAFLLSRSQKQSTYIREVQAQFGWSDRTAQKWLTFLIFNGLAKGTGRRQKGKFSGLIYSGVPLDQAKVAGWELRTGRPHRNLPDGKKPDTVLLRVRPPDSAKPDAALADAYKEINLSTLNHPPTKDKTRYGSGHAGTGGRDANACLDDDGGVSLWLEELAAVSPALYEVWSDDDSYDVDVDAPQMAYDLFRATDGRIARRLLKDAGLEGFRRLVARAASIGEAEAGDAYAFILGLISKRFAADKGRWLNSWGWLGKRLMGAVREYGDIPTVDQVEKWEDGIPF
jgi:predicted DNA-binding transcriptional regulator